MAGVWPSVEIYCRNCKCVYRITNVCSVSPSSRYRGNNNRGGNRGGSGRGGNFRGAPRGRGRGDFQPRGRGGFQSRGGGGGGGGFAGQKRGFQDQYSGNVSGMEFVKKRKVNDNVHRMLVPVKSVKTIIGPVIISDISQIYHSHVHTHFVSN